MALKRELYLTLLSLEREKEKDKLIDIIILMYILTLCCINALSVLHGLLFIWSLLKFIFSSFSSPHLSNLPFSIPAVKLYVNWFS